MTSYEDDSHAWWQEQLQLLKEKKFDALDIDNVIYEFETLGCRSIVRHQLYMYLLYRIKREHLLKEADYWNKQTLMNNADLIKITLEQTPKLRCYLENIIEKEYADARLHAHKKISQPLRDIPKKCPWTLEEIINDYWTDDEIRHRSE